MKHASHLETDPVCGMQVDPREAAATKYFFCSPGCAKQFDGDPRRLVYATVEWHHGH